MTLDRTAAGRREARPQCQDTSQPIRPFLGLRRGAAIGHHAILPYTGSLLAGVVLWKLAVLTVPHLVLPAPWIVLLRLPGLLVAAATWKALAAMFEALLVGVVLAVGTDIPLGIALGSNRALAVASEPMINAIYAVPSVAMVPFLIIWFGPFFDARVGLVFLMAFFETLVTIWTGVRIVDPRLVDAARSFGARSAAVVLKVYRETHVAYTFRPWTLEVAR